MKRWMKITISVVAVLFVIGLGITYFIRSHSAPAKPETATAHRTTVTSTVEFTGQTAAHTVAKLGFESLGTIKSVNVSVGDHVTAGQTLAVLDPRTQSLTVAQAFATRVSTERDRQLAANAAQSALAATTVDNARTLALRQQAVRDAKAELDQATAVWEQAVRESGDQSSITQGKYSAVAAAASAYHAAQKALSEQQTANQKTEAAAQANVQSAQADYAATQQAAQGISGISALGAAQAIAEVQLSKTLLTAPFAGTVTVKNIERGELVPAGTAVLTIQSNEPLEVTADVPETSVAKLATGQQATITFDAYGSDQSFTATVTKIDPAATVIEGVPTYHVTLSLLNPPASLRAGFTANVTVHVAEQVGVLAIPRRAVFRRDGKSYVQVLGTDGHTEDREVQTGLVGSDGLVEIIHGLSEGEQVLTHPS